ncbi:MAG: bifunctional folylpolyglutamate synthase/dihydrofolate synthase [Alphaproteobacteria bacterium]|nr:bifunctional folylpolyglutamate synthase/dihydrofolate synthase [Alphaproteobacteria bacterium]
MSEPASPVDRVLARLGGLHPKRVDRVDSSTLSLHRIERLLTALGSPQDRLPPVIHVAGTNGKGSTVATLRACLEAAGRSVHVFTSPHLVRFNERIRVAGHLIEDEALAAALDEVDRVNAGAEITFFEIATAAAFLVFARVPADFSLLEVGLGGRLDTTNVVQRPAVTAITPVSLDHQAFLGPTIGAIAGEKAGILKPGAPAVIGPQTAEAETVIEARANLVGAPLRRWQQEWRCDAAGGGMRYTGPRWTLDLPLPSLPGAHQIGNAGVAIACLECLPPGVVSSAAIAEGLRRIDWPARLQRLTRGSLVEMVPGWELWLDGGHNPAAGQVLAEAAAAWHDRPLHLVVGMLNTKDAAGFLAPLAPLAQSLHAVTIPGEENALPAAAIAAAARSVGMTAGQATSLKIALQEIVAADARGRILICGSLHFAGMVLRVNE